MTRNETFNTYVYIYSHSYVHMQYVPIFVNMTGNKFFCAITFDNDQAFGLPIT